MTWKFAGVLALVLGLAGCHDKGHEHEHGTVDPDKAAERLSLNHGQKWQTDAALRAGLTAIRDALQAEVQPIHEKTLSPEGYATLGGRIEKELGTIVASCKLPKDADEQLHLVLVQISTGADQMKKDGDRMGGAVRVIKGLESYAKYFDHPDWKPIEH